MKSSWVLARLDDETGPRHTAADNDRLALLTAPATIAGYRDFLTHVYGFESVVESALQMTADLDDVVDLRARSSMRLLRSDLLALGIAEPGAVARCESVFPFRTVLEAMGWIYVLERNALLHGVLRRHLEQRLGDRIANATAYFAGNERAVGARMRELGIALDGIAATYEVADRIAAAASAAFECQHRWFARLVPARVRVA